MTLTWSWHPAVWFVGRGTQDDWDDQGPYSYDWWALGPLMIESRKTRLPDYEQLERRTH